MMTSHKSTQIAGRHSDVNRHSRSGAGRTTPGARIVRNYRIIRKLGQGSMGEVYLAERQSLKQRCAVKLMRAEKANDTLSKARFQAEVRTLARLTHPNTVRILDHGVAANGTCYYAMECLSGRNLEEIVSDSGPLPPERVVHLLRQICSALKEAHLLGLVHRDIKPANIFAAKCEGRYDVAKLLDFGLVKSSEQGRDSATLDGAFVGSPNYAPPETTIGDQPFDARGDIYSLGATAYHLLTGQPVFKDSNPLKVIFAHANEVPTLPSALRTDIPQELTAIVMKCLEKRPDDRFTTVELLDKALSQIQIDNRWTQERAAEWWRQHRGLPKTTPVEAADTATCLIAGATK